MGSLKLPVNTREMYITNSKKTLLEIILNNQNFSTCDEFIIISGYLGPDPIEKISKKNINTKIFYGMSNESLNSKFHEKLKELDHTYDKTKIYYPSITTHTKIYIWRKDREILKAFTGSANFSSNSLLKIDREILVDVIKDDFNSLNNYIEKIESSSIRCYDHSLSSKNDKKDVNIDPNIFSTASLFGNASKINWGHSPNGKVNKRDSYIPIRKADIINYPSLFPPKEANAGLGYADNEPIEVIWDDNTTMVCLLEGSQLINNIRYPNKISSYGSKRIIGDYIRKRMDLEPGTFVSELHFRRYGRDNIEISLISNNVYYFNFGTN